LRPRLSGFPDPLPLAGDAAAGTPQNRPRVPRFGRWSAGRPRDPVRARPSRAPARARPCASSGTPPPMRSALGEGTPLRTTPGTHAALDVDFTQSRIPEAATTGRPLPRCQAPMAARQ